VWRHHDVIFTLGGGIDHVTKEPAPSPETLTNKITDYYLTMAPLAPLMHGAAQWGVLGPLFTGTKVVLWSGRFDPHAVWRMVERERVNTIQLTGDAMGRPLVEALAEPGAHYDLSSVLVITSTAAVFSPSVKAQYLERFPYAMLLDATGSSEQGFTGLSTVTKESLEQTTAQAKGVRVNPGRDVAVFDEQGKRVAPGSGVIGKLARGGNVPLGYYKDAQKTAETFVEIEGRRWAVPGDYAIVETDGTIVVLGRGSVSINSGGEKIFPEEVEGALKSHPAVFDALVVGVPDERWGSRVAAVLHLRPGQRVTLEELAAAARTSPATKCRASCTWWNSCAVRRAASPTIRGRRKWRAAVRIGRSDARASVGDRGQERPLWLVVQPHAHQGERLGDPQAMRQAPAQQVGVARRHEEARSAEDRCRTDECCERRVALGDGVSEEGDAGGVAADAPAVLDHRGNTLVNGVA
jgi:acyl-CoA synthetase (AMP-forming)/AMP-acid ligase II